MHPGPLFCPYCECQKTLSLYATQFPLILSASPRSLLDKARPHPLDIRLCTQCHLGFNATPLDEPLLSEIYDNYVYISPMSGIGTSRYQGMLKTLERFCDPKDFMVEIGCSEGYLIQQLQERGYGRVMGIEPGPQALEGQAAGLDISRAYFSGTSFEPGRVDCFYLMHVFEHFPDPFIILTAMKKQLAPRGKIIMEVPHFDGFRHEHLFYYSPRFFDRLGRDMGLIPLAFEMDNTIGSEALRITWAHGDNPDFAGVDIPGCDRDLEGDTLRKHQQVRRHLKALETFILEREGKPMFWWGAGTASIIYLNQLDRGILARADLRVVDGDPKKWGLFIPGVEFEIGDFKTMAGEEGAGLIIASSFYKEIQATLDQNNLFPDAVKVITDFI